jgi:asparaginyl-tRNA synthetase
MYISIATSLRCYPLSTNTMAPFYIDEATGSDTSADGTQEKPYQSLGYAVFAHGQTTPESFQIRKDSGSPYEEPTQSALKKAKKTADGIEKKRKKQEELDAKKNAEDKEKHEKLEASKKIVLTEDLSLPQAAKVR